VYHKTIPFSGAPSAIKKGIEFIGHSLGLIGDTETNSSGEEDLGDL